jgi:hypothetical protein
MAGVAGGRRSTAGGGETGRESRSSASFNISPTFCTGIEGSGGAFDGSAGDCGGSKSKPAKPPWFTGAGRRGFHFNRKALLHFAQRSFIPT